MSATAKQREDLFKILREINLGPIFVHPASEASLLERLERFGSAYEAKMRGVPAGVLPAGVSLVDILAEHDQNPHRVHMLLEAVAFQCSPEMLAMAWMTLLGARIERLSYTYSRERTSQLSVILLLPDLTTTVNFDSVEHWDAALLRFAALSKADDQPVIEGFHGFWIPPKETWDHDYYVHTAQGSFGAVDIAPTASPTPRWEIWQVFSSQSPRDVGSVAVHVQGPPHLFPRPSESQRPILELAWSALVRKYGEDTMNRRPARSSPR